MILMTYTDKERVDIAWKEYTDYKTGQVVKINNNRTTIGTVVDVIDQSDNGLYMTVIKESDIYITLQDKQFYLFYSVL